MAERVFVLPDLGEGLEDAEVVEWRVREGQVVKLNEVLVEVNTAKALVEIPSPFEGVVTRLHARPGDVVKVGEPLVTIEAPQEGAGEVLVGYGPGQERASSRRVRLRPPGEGRREPVGPGEVTGPVRAAP
ncbi:MAG TPA: biotin/lipoyl-containing protein, partial [Actinomycetota bacterium]|nr:biotin/lipoyl-containing protein [Actinomycetota bacterium]